MTTVQRNRIAVYTATALGSWRASYLTGSATAATSITEVGTFASIDAARNAVYAAVGAANLNIHSEITLDREALRSGRNVILVYTKADTDVADWRGAWFLCSEGAAPVRTVIASPEKTIESRRKVAIYEQMAVPRHATSNVAAEVVIDSNSLIGA